MPSCAHLASLMISDALAPSVRNDALAAVTVPVPTGTCPVSTDRWTRRVHFVREGGRGAFGCEAQPARPRRSCFAAGAGWGRTG